MSVEIALDPIHRTNLKPVAKECVAYQPRAQELHVHEVKFPRFPDVADVYSDVVANANFKRIEPNGEA